MVKTKRTLIEALVCLAPLALLGCSSGSGRSSSGSGVTWVPLPLGQVTVLAPAYACAPGSSLCYDLEVTCPGVALPARCSLRVASDPLVASRGAILLTTGGEGFGFFADESPEGPRIVGDMHAAGFTTVELEWIDSWLQGSSPAEGQALLAGRPATVARWVHDNLYAVGTGTAFCATGNSAGAAQIMYSMTHYGLESMYSLVVPTGGPPMSRIDWGCLPGTGPDPEAEYETESAKTIDLGYGFAKGTGPCFFQDPTFVTVFQDSSQAYTTHDYFFPNTMVWLVVGDQDATAAPAQAAILLDLLLEEQSPLIQQSVAPSTAHNVPGTVQGANLVRDILLGDCVPR